MVSAVFPAAGVGKRMGAGRNKVLLDLARRPILLHTLLKFSACPSVGELIVIVRRDEIPYIESLLQTAQGLKPYRLAEGGSERQYSIQNGLAYVSAQADIILVHDAARPLVSRETIEAVIERAQYMGAAIAAVPAKNTIKVRGEDGTVQETLERGKLWEVQTPQGFRRDILLRAYAKAAEDGFLGTDDASLVERLGQKVAIVQGDYRNVKITTPEDLVMAEALLGQRSLSHARETAGEALTVFKAGLKHWMRRRT